MERRTPRRGNPSDEGAAVKYIERLHYIEFHPENESDRDYIRQFFGAVGGFDYWCKSKEPFLGRKPLGDWFEKHHDIITGRVQP